MRKNGGLKAVIRGLESADPDVKKQSAFALSIIVEDCTRFIDIILRFCSMTESLLSPKSIGTSIR